MSFDGYKKFMLENFTLKKKYTDILISELPSNGFNIDKYEKLGDISIELFLYSINFNNGNNIKYKYDTFIDNATRELKIDSKTFKAYIGFSEYIIDQKTKVGVGYGVVYNILSNLMIV